MSIRNTFAFPDVAVAATTATSTWATYDVARLERCMFDIEAVSGNTSQFIIQGRASAKGTYYDMYSTSAAYVTFAGILIGVGDENPFSLDSTAGTFLLVETSGLESLRFQGRGTTVGTITIYGGGV